MRALNFVGLFVTYANAWSEVDRRETEWRTCESDADCGENAGCFSEMVLYSDGNYASNHGCFNINSCQDTMTWQGTELKQYFCNEQQKERSLDAEPLTWGTSVDQRFTEWQPACSFDSDIPCPIGLNCLSTRGVHNENGSDIYWDIG